MTPDKNPELLNDILPFVKKPSRYIGGEINSIRKKPSPPLSIALCFPDVYEIGTSHFGLQILYHVLNREDTIAAERVFAPGLDMEELLRARGLPLFSLESKKAVGEFNIVAFSLLYELNYTAVLSMLDLAGIPFFSADREDAHPLIIAGGPCTFNPEPVANFFDAIVIGDGEQTAVRMAHIWLGSKTGDSRPNKNSLLKQWAALPGVYVPQFYEVETSEAGFTRPVPQ